MQRHREIAAAPERLASETWDTICRLIVDTLARSSSIDGAKVRSELDRVRGVGTALVAGGHLVNDPVVVVADPVYLNITTATGDAAIALDENLDPVPGGASADRWRVYLPTPNPLADIVEAAIDGSSHLSAASPPSPEQGATASRASDVRTWLDRDALAKRQEL
jgi:hypothetical protein